MEVGWLELPYLRKGGGRCCNSWRHLARSCGKEVGGNYRTFGKGMGGVVTPGDTWPGAVARRWVGTTVPLEREREVL